MFDTRPPINVAIEPSSQPFSFEQAGKLTGFDVELMNAIADKIGVKINYRPTPLENMFEAVNKNYVEVAIGSLSVTEERKKLVSFTEPYLEDGGLSVVAPKGKTVTDPRDLAGLTVGVRSGSTGELLATGVSGAKVTSFASNVDMTREFSLGTLDTIVHDRLILKNLIDRGLLPSGVVITPLKKEEYAIAYDKNNKALGDDMNRALDEMKKNGELRALRDKWFGPGN